MPTSWPVVPELTCCQHIRPAQVEAVVNDQDANGCTPDVQVWTLLPWPTCRTTPQVQHCCSTYMAALGLPATNMQAVTIATLSQHQEHRWLRSIFVRARIFSIQLPSRTSNWLSHTCARSHRLPLVSSVYPGVPAEGIWRSVRPSIQHHRNKPSILSLHSGLYNPLARCSRFTTS